MTIHRYMGYSGGKDSTALYLHLMERGRPFIPMFADTDNEAPELYDYVRELPAKTGGPEIKWVKADLTKNFEIKRKNLPTIWAKAGVPQKHIDRAMELCHPTGNVFIDVCILRGGFPYIKSRFCTEYLKLRPFAEVFRPLEGIVFNYTGVRRAESVLRRNYPLRSWDKLPTLTKKPVAKIHPLVDWTLADVMEQHAKHGIKPNPLYELGVDRVGCWPCVFARKAEISIIARHSPEKIAILREWEALMEYLSRHGNATFFPARNLGKEPPYNARDHGIDEQVKWSQTVRGMPNQFRFTEFDDNENAVLEEFNTACNIWGTCE